MQGYIKRSHPTLANGSFYILPVMVESRHKTGVGFLLEPRRSTNRSLHYGPARIMIFLVSRPELVKPLDVAEVLTVRQFLVLREHTYSILVRTGLDSLEVKFEGVVIALFLNHLERIDVMNLLFLVRIVVESDQFKAYCVLQSLLVDDVCQFSASRR